MISTDLSTRAGDGYAVVAAGEPVIVGLTGLEFIDSSGVAALACGRRQARPAGVTWRSSHPGGMCCGS